METGVKKNFLDGIFSGLRPNVKKHFPMIAIWLSEPVRLGSGNMVRRVEPGYQIELNGELYLVKKCYGTLSSSELFMDLQQVSTGETSTLKIN